MRKTLQTKPRVQVISGVKGSEEVKDNRGYFTSLLFYFFTFNFPIEALRHFCLLCFVLHLRLNHAMKKARLQYKRDPIGNETMR